MVSYGKNLVMRDTLGFIHGWMQIQEDNKLAIENFHHLNDPSDSNAICVLEGKEEMEANEYTHFVNHDFRLFFLEKKDGAKIGCARLHKWEDRLDIGCYIIPSERGKDYAIEVLQILGSSLLIPAKRVQEMVDAWLKLNKYKHTL
jgi:predicted acetyltransferase